MTRKIALIIVLLAYAFVVYAGLGASVTLIWDISVSPSVTGYKVYYGPNHPLNQTADVGQTNTATINGLSPGFTYWFTATAYDGSGVQSPFSNEVSQDIPGASPSPSTSPAMTASPTVSPAPTPGARPRIVQLRLVSNPTGQVIMDFVDGMDIYLADLPTQDVNIEALATDNTATVTFKLGQLRHVELTAPFGMCGDWSTCPANTFPVSGQYQSLWVQPRDPNGTIGLLTRYTFNVYAGSARPAPNAYEPTPPFSF